MNVGVGLSQFCTEFQKNNEADKEIVICKPDKHFLNKQKLRRKYICQVGMTAEKCRS